MTVAVMLETISSSELTEWLAFGTKVEPFGGMVEDMRAGLAPSMTVNINQAEGSTPVGPLDFFPWHQSLIPPTLAPLPAGLTEQEKAERLIDSLRIA